MKQQNFTTSYLVDQSPERVFAAVNDVRAWWSGEIEGRTDALGAEFTYRYKHLHETTQRITEFVPGKKVVWRIVASTLSFVDDQKEWDGTEVVFEIAKKDGRTELRFTHVGLSPAIKCYGECSGAWGFFVNESLRSLITTGKGVPNPEA
ncbi:MAG TPA: SRPBCC domain-containing protein [Polyangiaceae bacterium]|nr:SRPBCC domain-containing protein [Polyangiaceae bacterium]